MLHSCQPRSGKINASTIKSIRGQIGQSRSGEVSAALACLPDGNVVVTMDGMSDYPFFKGPAFAVTDDALGRFFDKGMKKRTQHTFSEWEQGIVEKLGLNPKNRNSFWNILDTRQRIRYEGFKAEHVENLPE